MSNSLVSIIVSVYNAEKFLRNTIKTIEEQSYSDWEVVFVNDSSTDRSKEIIEAKIKENKKFKLINLEKNSGVAVARNTGIKVAEGRYIAFLDADDLWKKDKLEKQIKFVKENDCAFCFTGYEFADEDGNSKHKIVRVPKIVSYKQALKNTTIFTSTVMLDTEKVSKELIQMPNVKSEDTATWWKILKNGYVAYGLDESLTYYRRSEGTLSSNKFKAISRIWNLYRNVEELNYIYSAYNFCFYAFNAIKRRV